MELFFTPYGAALFRGFFITIFFLAAVLFFSKRFAVTKQSVHHTKSPLFRFGGLALIGGFLLALLQNENLVFSTSWWVFFGVLLLALIIGLWDDVKNLNWKYQLAAQVILLSTLYAGGVKIVLLTNPSGGVFHLSSETFFSFGFVIFLAWGLLLLNALNWLDGVDGLAGSVITATYSTLFMLALSPVVQQPALAIFLATAIGATFAFLVYNHPPAKIIAGTSGTLFFGLSIVFVSVVAGAKIATTLLVLAIPIVDAGFVLIKRIVQKRSIFAPDHGHLHHVLRKRGWSDWQIIITYLILTFCIGIIALHTQSLGKLTSALIIFGALSVLFAFLHLGKRLTRTTVFFGGVLATALFLSFIVYTLYFAPVRNVLINDTWYQLEVANTDAERSKGLSERAEICARCGMIFLFPKPTTPAFWMKDMRFSLDILWVKEGVVVSKNENVPFPSLEQFRPDTPVDAVIELPAGAAQNISSGDKIFFW